MVRRNAYWSYVFQQIDLNTQNVHTIANTQDQILAQLEAYSTHYVPSVVSATTATTPSGLAHSAADTRFDKLGGSIESIVQQLRMLSQNQHHNRQQLTHSSAGNNARRILGDPNAGPWRQWKYWCYTCATNLTHASVDCHKTGRRKPSHHQYKVTATKDNPQEGGNSRKDCLWMKWCHLATYEPHDTKGGA